MAQLTDAIEMPVTPPTALDREHDIIMKATLGLHDAILGGKALEVIGPLVDLLVRFSAEHFSMEERVMHQYGYADAVRHAAAHEKLQQKLHEIQQRTRRREMPTVIDTLELLCRFSEHIDVDDRIAEEGMGARQACEDVCRTESHAVSARAC